MHPFKLVVFDIAGTTVEDRGNVAESFIRAFFRFGMDISAESANRVMGFRKKEAITMLLEELPGRADTDTNELVEKIHDAFIQNMIHHYETDKQLRPLPGAEALFTLLRSNGMKVALNTGFIKAITDVILRKLGWDNHPAINLVISSDEVAHARPHADMIHTLMERLHIEDAARVVKVGDTSVDVEEGRNAGCGLVVSVTTGAFTRAQLEACAPDAVIDRLDALPALLSLVNTTV
jgi:phosphonatase-like hydrolase